MEKLRLLRNLTVLKLFKGKNGKSCHLKNRPKFTCPFTTYNIRTTEKQILSNSTCSIMSVHKGHINIVFRYSN